MGGLNMKYNKEAIIGFWIAFAAIAIALNVFAS